MISFGVMQQKEWKDTINLILISVMEQSRIFLQQFYVF
jgi:hypothetical protein